MRSTRWRTRATLVMVTAMALAVLCPGPGAAHAEERGRLELGGLFGGHFFSAQNSLGYYVNGPAGNAIHDAAAFGLRLGYGLGSYWMLEGEFIVMPTSATVTQGQVTVFGLRAHVLFHFLTGRIRPFLLAGGVALITAPEYAAMIQRDAVGLFHGGAGIKFDLTQGLGLRLDGRVLLPPNLQGSVPTTDFEVFIGLYGRLGKAAPEVPPDADKDGVPDSMDKCPNEPGPRENGGCPDKDSDNDGIIDRLDKCPAEAGPKENGGCPDKDSDNDGIVDRLDKCPTAPGPKENEGCPDVDTDKDGIVDRLDKCPTEPETVNGYQDEDGCPDEVPAAVKQFTGAIQGITFAPNKAVILPASFPVLDKAVAVLKEHSSVNLLIVGHTDNVGPHDVNVTLSQQRAEAVRQYLIDKGIDASRLQALGKGPDEPVAPNKTAAGRARNRRVEFHLVTAGQAPAAPAAKQPAKQPAPVRNTPPLRP